MSVSPAVPCPHTGPTRDLPTELPPNAGRAAAGIAIVLVAQLMLVLDATVVNVALPRIDADLGFGPASLSWVLNAYTLAFGGLLLLGGRLGDVFGRLKIFEVGLAIFTRRLRSSAASPRPRASWSPPAPSRASAPRWPRPACSPCSPRALPTRPRATGRSPCSAPSPRAARRSACCSAASSPTSARGAGRCSSTSRSASPCSLLARASSTETQRRPGRFDVVGAVTATLGAVSLVWALIGTPEHGWISARTLGGFAVGLVLLAVLARTERRVARTR